MSLFPIISPPALAPATATFVASLTGPANTAVTTFTWTGFSIGAAAADRKVVACISLNALAAGQTISGLTIDGNAMTEVAQSALDAESISGMYEYELAAGTTAEFIVTASGNFYEGNLAVYTITGAALTVSSTATTSADDTPNTTLNCPANGCIIGTANSRASPTSAAWSGITERQDESHSVGAGIHTSASDNFATQQTALAIACTFSPQGTQTTMALASWGPA